VIEPLLPNKPRGVPRVDDRRVLNGIFWVLRSVRQGAIYHRHNFAFHRGGHIEVLKEFSDVGTLFDRHALTLNSDHLMGAGQPTKLVRVAQPAI
jgi:hypothetical protein